MKTDKVEISKNVRMVIDAVFAYASAKGYYPKAITDHTGTFMKIYKHKDGETAFKLYKFDPDKISDVNKTVEAILADVDNGKWLTFENHFVSRKIPQSKLYISTSPVSDVVNDIFKKFKEKEMGTKRIDWKVDSVEIDTRISDLMGGGTKFYARIVGTPDPLFAGYVGEIKGDLQNYLNKYKEDDEVTKYIANDVDNVYRLANWPKQNPYVNTTPKIKDVIFNDPATIVFWSDGTKTVVKCQNNDIFDPEKGLAMAMVKKMLGNKGNYCNELKKWLPKEKEDTPEVIGHVVSAEENENGVIARVHLAATEAAEKLKNALTKGFCSISMEIDEDE